MNGGLNHHEIDKQNQTPTGGRLSYVGVITVRFFEDDGT